MPNFTPNSKIYIGRVPWDNSYRHTRLFGSASAQTSWMQGRCTQALAKENYTYVRMNNAIRVPFNAESLYTYNYVMYQNANYGTKWFYAFIVGINYINENTTELVLELDLMQTWMFDYSLKQCFVEREHVSDDTRGLHLNPEPAMDLEYIYDSFATNILSSSNQVYIVLLVSAMPMPSRSDNWYAGGGQPVSGTMYMNQYSACKVLLFKMWDNGLAQFQRMVSFYNSCGCADAIVDAYTVPRTSIDGTYVVSYDPWPAGTVNKPVVYTISDNCPLKLQDYAFSKPTTVDGYTPHNNKVLTYPYCYLEVGDFTGRKQDYRWEFFMHDTVHLYERIAAISDGQGYVLPLDYNGIDANFNDLPSNKYVEPFTYDFSNKIPWMFSTYLNWAAQNQTVNQLAVIGGAAAMVGGFVPGVQKASEILGQGAESTANLMNLSSRNSPAGRNLIAKNNRYYENLASNAFKDNVSDSKIGGGAAAIAGTLANIDRMRRIPNTAKGNVSGNSRWQNGYSGWYYARVAIREEFARIVDGFLDMYGYQVDSLKIPNITSRPYWNYIKCQNSCNWGNVPADQMADINNIYNKGITFWHVDDIGNYSLDNRIAG